MNGKQARPLTAVSGWGAASSGMASWSRSADMTWTIRACVPISCSRRRAPSRPRRRRAQRYFVRAADQLRPGQSQPDRFRQRLRRRRPVNFRPLTLASLTDASYVPDNESDVTQRAVFGEAQLHMTDRFAVVAALRWDITKNNLVEDDPRRR